MSGKVALKLDCKITMQRNEITEIKFMSSLAHLTIQINEEDDE